MLDIELAWGMTPGAFYDLDREDQMKLIAHHELRHAPAKPAPGKKRGTLDLTDIMRGAKP